MAQDPRVELKMNAADLYREEVFTDRRVGTLRMMTPVKTDGSTDTARKTLFLGEAQILTPMGALPVAFEIEAATLGEAAEKFGDGAKAAVERTVRELREMRREQASSILVADGLPGGGLGGGLPGGLPGGGKIQLR